MNFKDFSYILYYKEEYKQYIPLLLQKEYNDIMVEASYNGHIDIVKLMIEHGANNFNFAMKEASFNGHIDIVKLMIENGADNFFWSILYAGNNNQHEMHEFLENYKKNK